MSTPEDPASARRFFISQLILYLPCPKPTSQPTSGVESTFTPDAGAVQAALVLLTTEYHRQPFLLTDVDPEGRISALARCNTVARQLLGLIDREAPDYLCGLFSEYLNFSFGERAFSPLTTNPPSCRHVFRAMGIETSGPVLYQMQSFIDRMAATLPTASPDCSLIPLDEALAVLRSVESDRPEQERSCYMLRALESLAKTFSAGDKKAIAKLLLVLQVAGKLKSIQNAGSLIAAFGGEPAGTP